MTQNKTLKKEINNQVFYGKVNSNKNTIVFSPRFLDEIMFNNISWIDNKKTFVSPIKIPKINKSAGIISLQNHKCFQIEAYGTSSVFIMFTE